MLLLHFTQKALAAKSRIWATHFVAPKLQRNTSPVMSSCGTKAAESVKCGSVTQTTQIKRASIQNTKHTKAWPSKKDERELGPGAQPE